MNKQGKAEFIMLADNSSEYSMPAIDQKRTFIKKYFNLFALSWMQLILAHPCAH